MSPEKGGDQEITRPRDGRPAPAPSALDDAIEVSRGAAAKGFDWADASGPLNKVEEELRELREASRGDDPSRVEAELGDLLFAVTNVARHLRVCPEAALQAAVARFRNRFDHVEASLAAEDRGLDGASPEELEAAWEVAKSVVG